MQIILQVLTTFFNIRIIENFFQQFQPIAKLFRIVTHGHIEGFMSLPAKCNSHKFCRDGVNPCGFSIKTKTLQSGKGSDQFPKPISIIYQGVMMSYCFNILKLFLLLFFPFCRWTEKSTSITGRNRRFLLYPRGIS